MSGNNVGRLLGTHIGAVNDFAWRDTTVRQHLPQLRHLLTPTLRQSTGLIRCQLTFSLAMTDNVQTHQCSPDTTNSTSWLCSPPISPAITGCIGRSEERRVGKESR